MRGPESPSSYEAPLDDPYAYGPDIPLPSQLTGAHDRLDQYGQHDPFAITGYGASMADYAPAAPAHTAYDTAYGIARTTDTWADSLGGLPYSHAPATETAYAPPAAVHQPSPTETRQPAPAREWRPGETITQPDVARNIVLSFDKARRLYRDFLPDEEVAQGVRGSLEALAQSYEPNGPELPRRPELTKPQAECAESALWLVRVNLGEQLRMAGYGHIPLDQLPPDWPENELLRINSLSMAMVANNAPKPDAAQHPA